MDEKPTMDRVAERPSPTRESKSQLARLVAMFHSPSAAFAAIGSKPTLAAVLIATALAGSLTSTVVNRATDLDAMALYAYEQQRENMPGTISRNLSDADDARALDAVRTGLRLTRNFAPVLGGIGAVIAPLAAAGFFLLLFGILGSPGSFRVILSTVAHAGWPPVAASTLLTCLVVGLSSVADLLPGLDGAAEALASRADLFLAWELALVTIGFAITLGITRRRSFAVVLGLWALGTVGAVGIAVAANFIGFQVGAAPA